jgi:hypothetical protein
MGVTVASKGHIATGLNPLTNPLESLIEDGTSSLINVSGSGEAISGKTTGSSNYLTTPG